MFETALNSTSNSQDSPLSKPIQRHPIALLNTPLAEEARDTAMAIDEPAEIWLPAALFSREFSEPLSVVAASLFVENFALTPAGQQGGSALLSVAEHCRTSASATATARA